MKLLGQFRHRIVPFDRGQRHLRLEGRFVIPSRPLYCLAPLRRHLPLALVKPGYHLPHCPNFRSPLYIHTPIKYVNKSRNDLPSTVPAQR